MILDPESAEHRLAVQEFRQSYYDVDPNEVFGADGWVIQVVDSRAVLVVTASGLDYFEQLSKEYGPRAVAIFDQFLAGGRREARQQRT